MNRSLNKYAIAVAVGMGAALALGSAVPAQAWEPKQPIEFVIQTSPGGGSDQYARYWIGIIEKYKLSPQPIIPVNKPGGAGAVSLAYLAGKKGDPHYISPTLNSIITTALLQKIPVMYPSEDLTPIALMMIDPFLLVVNPEKYKDFDAFHAACKKERLTSVGTGSKSEDEIQISMIKEAFDCQPFRYVPAKGGGDVAAQVAGKHADFNVNQPSEMLPHHPERLIPIMSFQKQRPAEFKDAVTHHEKGITGRWANLLDLETGLHQMRGIIGAPDMPKEAVDWYVNLFKKVYETQEWKDFMKKGAMVPQFLGPDEYKKFLIDFENNHVEVMRDVIKWDLRDDLRKR